MLQGCLPQKRQSLVIELHDIDAHIGLFDQLVFPFAHGSVACDELVQALAEQNFFVGDGCCIGVGATVDVRLDGVADEHRRKKSVQVDALGERRCVTPDSDDAFRLDVTYVPFGNEKLFAVHLRRQKSAGVAVAT